MNDTKCLSAIAEPAEGSTTGGMEGSMAEAFAELVPAITSSGRVADEHFLAGVLGEEWLAHF